jgi:hypothetical protein
MTDVIFVAILKLQELTHLTFNGTNLVQNIPDLSGLPQLKHLNFNDVKNLQSIAVGEYLSNLTAIGVQPPFTQIGDADYREFITYLITKNPLLLRVCVVPYSRDYLPIRMIATLPLEFIIEHLQVIIENVLESRTIHKLPNEIRSLLGIVYRCDPKIYQERLSRFADSAVAEVPALLVTEIAEEMVLKRPLATEKIELTEYPDVEIRKLLEYFDYINFSCPGQPNFFDLSVITTLDSTMTPEILRSRFEIIFNSIEGNLPLATVPEEETERKNWYQYLELVLKNIVVAIESLPDDSVENERLVAKELIELANSGFLCGTKMRSQAQSCLKAIRKEEIVLNGEGVTASLDIWIDQFKEAIAMDLARRLPLGNTNQPHTFGLVIKALLEKDVFISERVLDSVDLDDTMLNTNISSTELYEAYLQLLDADTLTFMVHSRLQDEFQKNSALSIDCIECLTVYYEARCLREGEAQKIAGLSHENRFGYLKDRLVQEKFIDVTLDEEMWHAKQNITFLGAYSLLQHFGYIR